MVIEGIYAAAPLFSTHRHIGNIEALLACVLCGFFSTGTEGDVENAVTCYQPVITPEFLILRQISVYAHIYRNDGCSSDRYFL